MESPYPTLAEVVVSMYLKTAGALTNSQTQKLRNQLGPTAGAVSSTYRQCQHSLSLSYDIFVVAGDLSILN